MPEWIKAGTQQPEKYRWVWTWNAHNLNATQVFGNYQDHVLWQYAEVPAKPLPEPWEPMETVPLDTDVLVADSAGRQFVGLFGRGRDAEVYVAWCFLPQHPGVPS